MAFVATKKLMREQTIHLHQNAPAKPAEGQTCNGCGICCALETCPPARLRFMQAKGPCPALAWSEHKARYYCGLMSSPRKYLGWLPLFAEAFTSRLISRWIAAGKGCDCNADVQP